MACLSYDHAVIYNGVFYPANTPIPVTEEATEEKAVTPEETATEEATEEKAVNADDNKRKSRKPKSANTAD